MNTPTNEILSTLLRASAMPMAFACPGSIRTPNGPILNENNAAARTGSAAHKCAESLPATGSIEWDRIDAISDEYDTDSNELRYLCRQAQRIWTDGAVIVNGEKRRLRDSFQCASTEIAISHTLSILGLRITGTLDGLVISGNVGRAYDWKFGRLDSDYYHQMMAYASMLLEEFEFLEEVTITILWARDQEIENYTITRTKAREWLERAEREVVMWDGVYRPSEKCVHCPRSYECHAFNALARRNAAVLFDLDVATIGDQLQTMEPDRVIELERKAKMLGVVCGKAREAVHDLVKKKGEVVGSKAKLCVYNQPRRELDVIKTWELIESLGLTEKDLVAITKLSVSKLEQLVRDRAEKGSGAKAVRLLGEKLEQVGAVEFVDQLMVKERRL